METITDYLKEFGSTKENKHSYSIVYDNIFKAFDRNEKLDILESGVEYGGSLYAWKEFFPNARITGVDIVDQRKIVRDDVEFVLSDIKEYKADRQFDIIIEDGSHSNEDAIWAAVNLSKLLKPNGILIIEDVQEGFMVPFILWGKLMGDYLLEAIDMRRITNSHDNFLIVIRPIIVNRTPR